jgi:hypothetical protein
MKSNVNHGKIVQPERQIAILILSILFIDLASRILGVAIDASLQIGSFLKLTLSWILFFLLLKQLFLPRKQCPVFIKLLRIAILLFIVKILFYVLFLGKYNHFKEILSLIMLSSLIIYDIPLRDMLWKYFKKYRYYLVAFAFLSFLPFIGSTSFGSTGERIIGLWDNSKLISWYFFGLLLMLDVRHLWLKIVLIICIMLGGARTGIITAGVYLVFEFLILATGEKKIRNYKTQVLTGIFLGIIVLGFFFSSGLVDRAINISIDNIRVLLTEDPASPSFGQGRGTMNLILIQGLNTFNSIDWVVGRSATDMYNLYIKNLGVLLWPHNDFLAVLYCYGILGFLSYLFAVFLIPLRTAFRTHDLFIITSVLRTGIVIALLGVGAGLIPYTASFLIITAYAKECKSSVNHVCPFMKLL